MHAEGEGSASARPKDCRHIAKCDEARHEHEFAEQARRPIGHEQDDKKARAISRVPFTDSHAVNPVDGGGELAMPKSADAVAGANQKRDAEEQNCGRDQAGEHISDLWIIGELLSVAEILASLDLVSREI